MKTKFCVTALVAGLASVNAFAQQAGEGYVGGQYSHITYDESGLPDFNPSALVIRAGYFVVDNVALEGRLGFGIADDSISRSGITLDVEVDSLAGFYAVGYLPLSGAASFYGLVGFSRAELTATASAPGFGSYSESADDTGFSFGVGAQVKFSPSVSGSLEYMSYLNKSDYSATALSAGLNFHF